jgi:hypothetical protein
MKLFHVFTVFTLKFSACVAVEIIRNWTYIRTFIQVSNPDTSEAVKLAVTYGIPRPELKDSKISVPVVLETLPYRKDDSEYITRFEIIDYFASHGFAYAFVDVRGTGGSDGVRVPYEYSDIEIEDLTQVIDQVDNFSRVEVIALI